MTILFRGITLILLFLGIIGLLTESFLFGVFFLLGTVLSGLICKFIAEIKGFDSTWGFIYGATWGALAIIVYLIVGKAKVKGN